MPILVLKVVKGIFLYIGTMPPKKYKFQMLSEAYNDVKRKGIAIRAAARRHSVSEATLRRKVNNPAGF